MPQLLTLREAADKLRVSTRSIDRLIKDGKLHPVKIEGMSRATRIIEDDLAALLSVTTTKPSPYLSALAAKHGIN